MSELKRREVPNALQGRYEHDWSGLVVKRVVSVTGLVYDMNDPRVLDIHLNGDLNATVWFTQSGCAHVHYSVAILGLEGANRETKDERE